jgi:hypothetical protein
LDGEWLQQKFVVGCDVCGGRLAAADGQEKRAGAAGATEFRCEFAPSDAGELEVGKDDVVNAAWVTGEVGERCLSTVDGGDRIAFGFEQYGEQLAAHLVVVDDQRAKGGRWQRHAGQKGIRPGVLRARAGIAGTGA